MSEQQSYFMTSFVVTCINTLLAQLIKHQDHINYSNAIKNAEKIILTHLPYKRVCNTCSLPHLNESCVTTINMLNASTKYRHSYMYELPLIPPFSYLHAPLASLPKGSAN